MFVFVCCIGKNETHKEMSSLSSKYVLKSNTVELFGSSKSVIKGPLIELGDSHTSTVKVAPTSALTLGSDRYQTQALSTAASANLYGFGVQIYSPLTISTCNRLVVLDVNAVGRSMASSEGENGFFKGTFVVSINVTQTDNAFTHTVSSEVGHYFKSNNIVGYVDTFSGTDISTNNPIWKLTLVWDASVLSEFSANNNGNISAVVTAHTTDALSVNGGRLVIGSVDKLDSEPENGTLLG